LNFQNLFSTARYTEPSWRSSLETTGRRPPGQRREKEALPMHVYDSPAFASGRYGVTLEALKQQLYSLHMRLLLSMQNHDEETQAALQQQIADVQKQIDDMNAGCR
jgi:hypothetical protein